MLDQGCCSDVANVVLLDPQALSGQNVQEGVPRPVGQRHVPASTHSPSAPGIQQHFHILPNYVPFTACSVHTKISSYFTEAETRAEGNKASNFVFIHFIIVGTMQLGSAEQLANSL